MCVPRGVSLQRFEVEGASEAEIGRAASHRSPPALRQSYLLEPPYAAMRIAAGFPAEAGHYVIARALTEPPKELVKSVFANKLAEDTCE
ncbi:MAG: hypothetical protein AAF368_19350 [Planctomycetota bacterium]